MTTKHKSDAVKIKRVRSVIDRLKWGRERIADPKHWQKGAAEFNGRFCALGAIGFHRSETHSLEARRFLMRALSRICRKPHGVVSVSTYNDNPRRTHAQIMRMFDTAIALAEKERTLIGKAKAK